MATLSEDDRSTTYTTGSATAGPFLVGFPLIADDHLRVRVNDELRTDYSVASDYSGGLDANASITFDAALDSGDVVLIEGDLPIDRQADLINGAPNLVSALNDEGTRLIIAVQEAKRDAAKADTLSVEVDDLVASAAASAASAAASAAIVQASTDVFVEKFGAVGDGATDCTTAVQAAIDFVATRISSSGAATAKAYVNFGPGIFVCEQLTIKGFVTLRGSGVSATEIRLKDGTDDHLIISPDFATLTGTDVCLPGEGVINNIGFEHLRLFGNKANNTAGDGIRVIAKNIRMDDVVIQDFPGNGLYTELGLQCPLNDWDIIVEGDIRGLKCFNNGGHGWHHRGPHDQYVTDFKSWLNGGDGWRIESNGSSYNPPTDFMHVHCYANSGKGLNLIGNTSIKGRFLRVENNGQEGLYVPSGNNCHFGFISALDNCKTSESNQVYIGSNYCTLDQLRSRRGGRAGAINGIEIAGNSNVVNVSCFGDTDGGGFSTGIGVKITGSFNSVRGTCEEWQSGTALSTAGNYNDVQMTTQNANVSWTHTQGTGSKFKITGAGKNGGTLKAGDGLNTAANLETADVFLRESGTATTFVLP